ncbi:F0-ATPase subunit J [Schizosaccharomyces japonicus yFS275]|uniref:F0-ATPase subunit J n=1 Tax=Schizosaccharomyces japonicus (strain yFS275 / FY16936) TaxID=402676 RepID=B6JZR0_SCHJY|nr:F0-ATPase subunit J [Schizosaccharomyces japonicus yFS275]EEB07028.1 F0-ATPase subunit J [Schizosaccharomyces japonicus yFS275]
MSFLGYKKYPTPVLRPLLPFIGGAAIVGYLFFKAQDKMLKSDTYKNDPRNPHAGRHLPDSPAAERGSN